MDIMFAILGVVALLAALWYFARKKISGWAKEDKYFTLLPTNKIKFITKSGGNIDRYLANLDDYMVDEETGQLREKTADDKKEVKKGYFLFDFYLSKSFWINHFGAEFIGLSKPLNYPIEVTDENGKVSEEQAGCLYHYGEYYVKVERAETKGQFPVDIFMKIVTRTHHAGKTIKFGSWLSMVVDPVKAAIRDHVAVKSPEELMAMQNENPTSGKKSDLMEAIFNLNDGIKGNKGLIDEVGQEIIEVNVVWIEVSDTDLKKALEAKKLAEEKGAADIKAAEMAVRVSKLKADADLKTAQGKAKSLKVIGEAEAKTLSTKLASLSGDAQALATIESAELIGEAIEKFKGTTLAINAGVALGVPAGATPEKKEKKS